MQNEVRNVTSFQTPILALRNGKLEKIIAVGDQEGKSPVYLSVDERGQSGWEPITNYHICDPNVLPISVDTFRNLSQELTTTGYRDRDRR